MKDWTKAKITILIIILLVVTSPFNISLHFISMIGVGIAGLYLLKLLRRQD